MGDPPLEKISLNVARRRTKEIQGRRTALALFPEEVWRLILKEVESPSDLWNVSQSTKQLNDILSKEKGTFFFDKIFPILFPHLDTQSIYNCHLVCKLWNSTIDSVFLHQTPSQINNRKPSEGSCEPLKLSSIFHVDSAEEKFLNTWNVPSFIEINLNTDQLDDFWISTKNLLHQYSPKVYHLKLVGCDRYAPAGLYNCLMEMFAILPNLKVLEIECKYEDHCMDIQVNGLKRIIGVSMLPPLKNLKKMRLDFWNVPPEFLQEMLKVYGATLKNLELNFFCDEGDHDKIWKDLRFPVLEKLVVDVCCFNVLCDVLRCMGEGGHLKVLSLVVPENRADEERLSLDLKNFFNEFQRNFKFIQVFGETEDLLDRFIDILGKLMGTWIWYDKLDNDGRPVHYFVHAGPGLCE